MHLGDVMHEFLLPAKCLKVGSHGYEFQNLHNLFWYLIRRQVLK